MTTISETTADPVQAIQDIYDAATGFSEWSDGDSDVDTSQSDNSYVNNGHVLLHEPTGQYVLMFAGPGYDHENGNNYIHYGVRVCLSNDWDDTNNEPQGDTTRVNNDPFDSGNILSNSFENIGKQGNFYVEENAISHGCFHLFKDYDAGGVSNSDVQDSEMSYVGAVGADYLYLAGFNDADTRRGVAGYFHFEEILEKFWSDGNENFIVHSKTMENNQENSDHRPTFCQYGWQHYYLDRGQADRSFNVAGFQGNAWGNVNPDTDDDTFFNRRPVVFETHNEKAPVAYVEQEVANDNTDGGAHGDVITIGSQDHRVFKRQGANGNITFSAALRHE